MFFLKIMKKNSWKIYREAEGEKMPKPEIEDFPVYMQPEYVNINGIFTHCWIQNGFIKITLIPKNDLDWIVTELGYNNCLEIERIIQSKGLTKYIKVGRFCENYTL